MAPFTKQKDTVKSDVDVMIISDDLTYADLYPILEAVSATLSRPVDPTIYSAAELSKRIEKRNAFVMRTLEQPRIWLIGNDNDITA